MPILSVRTSEGVVLELDVAGAGSRFAAGLVDGLLLGGALLALVLLAMAIGSVDPTGASSFVAALFGSGVLLVLALAMALIHAARGGTTPGKALLGLVVVGEDGQTPSHFAFLLRSFLWAVELVPLPVPVGLLVIFFHPRNQRLGDLVAGTLVIRQPRATAKQSEPWAGTRWSELETRTLPLTLGLAARLDADDLAYLRRVIQRRTLEPAVREHLIASVTRHYCERLGLEAPADERAALREIYLCLREVRAGLARD